MLNLTSEEIEFLKALGNEINTQDNRYTGTPYFYVVRERKFVTGVDARYSDDTVIVRKDGNDYEEFESEEAAVAQFIKEGMTPEEAQENFDDHCEEFGQYEYVRQHNMFLTYKGYLEHMKINGHNYSHKINPDTYGPEDDKKKLGGVYSYLEHAGRNPEMAKLIEILKKIGDSK